MKLRRSICRKALDKEFIVGDSIGSHAGKAGVVGYNGRSAAIRTSTARKGGDPGTEVLKALNAKSARLPAERVESCIFAGIAIKSRCGDSVCGKASLITRVKNDDRLFFCGCPQRTEKSSRFTQCLYMKCNDAHGTICGKAVD